MKGDFSRVTFRPEKDYSRVLMQQGRVQVDADWNEQMAILAHQNQIQIADVVGSSGAPAGSAGLLPYLRPGLDFRPDGPHIAIESCHAFSFSGEAVFTIEAWVCPRAGGPVLANTGAAISGGYALLIAADLTVRFERDLSPGPEKEHVRFHIATERKLVRDKYSHVAVLCQGQTVSIYISGELAATALCPFRPAPPDQPLRIAAREGDKTFDGEIADLRIWDICRTPQELHENLRALPPGRHAHLVGWYRFDADTAVATDYSGHEHDGVFVPDGVPRPAWIRRLWLQSGRYYVDGIVCQNRADISVTLPEADPDSYSRTLIWLDVWEDFVNALEDPFIRESALGGPDTAGRVQVRWQIQQLPLPESEWVHEESAEFPSWLELQAARRYRPVMLARTEGERSTENFENSLYRVEICASSEGGGAPAFLWSRDNASVVVPITEVIGKDSVRLGDMGSDELHIEHGALVELCSENTSISGGAPCLVDIKTVDRSTRIVEFANNPAIPSGIHLFLRVWKQASHASVHTSGTPESSTPIVSGKWITLERGIQVQFPERQNYSEGEYWLIPFRTAGSAFSASAIDWPVDEQGKPKPVHAYGGHRHGCLLALIENRGGILEILRSYRRTFAPLTRVASDENLFVRKSGDTMTGSLEIAGDLRVRDGISAERIRTGGTVHAREVHSREIRADEVVAGLVRGQLDAGMVDTPQLCDQSVTTEKLAAHSVTRTKLAFDIPELAAGFSLLRDSVRPVDGYVCVNRLLIHNPAIPWSRPDLHGRRVPSDDTIRAVACGHLIYLISENSGEMWSLDTTIGRTEKRASLPAPRRGFALAELDGKIYVIGGFESHDGKDEVSGSVTVYNPAHDHAGHTDHAHHAWRETAPLHHPRAYLAAAGAGGKLFAFGGEVPGFLRTRRTAICECFDPYGDTAEWFDCGSMIEPRSRFGLASHHGSLFAVGGLATGHFGGRITGTVEKFYPELIGGDWSCLLSSLPEPRSEAAVAFLDDRLFCAGGRKDGFFYSRRFTRDCQVFEAELNQWTAAPPMPVARHKASLVPRGNTLYAVGGRGPAIDRAEVLAIACCYYVFTESDGGD